VTASLRAKGSPMVRRSREPARAARPDQPRAARSALSLSMIAGVVALGVAALTALGIWQLERRIQKLDLIDRAAQRSSAAPIAAPGPAAWPTINARDDAYRRVQVTGRFLSDREVLVKAVTELGGGFWALTPFRSRAGFTVLVNRGFVPPDWRGDAAAKAAGRGEITVTGLLRITEPNGAFLRANDPAADRWYSRDVVAIASSLGMRDVAPYFIDADASADATGFPRGGLTVMAFPNNHLVYAMTWFALALMLLAGGILVAREEWRIRKSPPF
jgi:surfeit locus 1 family protein